ncbi:DNA translocase FtsK [Paenibacillus sp. 1011MAR3C5]|uniref:FtsK/SpoIIIE family DNA translocase n=1 Tax=Paenibacillus sp. 1011MAR3C5 TaxID=1675787 RepID=UPI000E6D1206|nr:DNA translocase FtsK [Paenibacillus sp. 1011MAR3C5]RJE86811.1 DNA translocase FtsK [Paenibacillus sp. 1011MAR3C5]
MAKKKRRKKSIGAQLKYEVYGILLITISIIALSGEAAVGRALSKLFGLALGKFYFVLALIGVYVGLTVMVKRAWPKSWSSRRTGLLILVLAFTLSSSISEVNLRFEGVDRDALSGGVIMSTLGTDLRDQLISVSPANDVSIRDKTISGGYIGAIQYSLLFMLFGYYGALIINIVMFAISIMLITGKSYVELLGVIRKRAGSMFKLLMAKRSAMRKRKAAKIAVVAAQGQHNEHDGTIEDVDDYQPAPPRKRKSLFFAWKQEGQQESKVQDQQDEWQLSQHEHAESGMKPVWESELAGDWEPSGERPVNADTAAAVTNDSEPPWAEADQEQGSVIHNEWHADGGSTAPAMEEEQVWPRVDAVPDDQEASLASVVSSSDEASDSDDEEIFESGEQQSNPLLDSEALISDGDTEGAVPRRPMDGESPAAKPYKLPPFTLLHKPSGMAKGSDATDMYDSRRKLEATLESFGVRAKVLDVVRGPAVTRYEVQPATGVKVSRIVGLTDDIALALAAKDVRMEAPIPGKSAIGIEVPNMEVSVVTMREVMETPAFHNSSSKLSIAFGRDISGQTIVGNLAKMPHLLVAGATGSGKSVCINGIITSILYKAHPDEVKFLMIDPKMVELNVYNGIPHLLAPVVTDPRRASLALKKIVVEMEKRYELFSKSSTRNIEGYNTLMADNPSAVLPYIVVIVDELADLMMVAAGDVEDSIARLAQMARAAGIHLIIATQRPSVDVITGVIKANIPSRIAFGVSSQVDSRTILDMAGAEKLLGRGDMLFLPVGMSKPIRVQGAFLSDQEVEALVAFARDQGEAVYKEDLVPEIEEETENPDMMLDELFDQAVQIVVEAKQASVSLLQRRMRVGYTRAARMIDQMEARGVVGPYEGSKPREVLMSLEQIQASRVSS